MHKRRQTTQTGKIKVAQLEEYQNEMTKEDERSLLILVSAIMIIIALFNI